MSKSTVTAPVPARTQANNLPRQAGLDEALQQRLSARRQRQRSQLHGQRGASPIAEALDGRELGGESNFASESAGGAVEPKRARATHAVVAQLSREVRQLETGGRSEEVKRGVSTGCEALDACLPNRGYVPGTVVEYLRATPACGASYLAFSAAAAAMRASSGFMVVVDNQDIRSYLYPPALAAEGIDLKKVIFVRPESLSDAIWAVDQSLRTPAVAVVVAELESFDDRSARRLQLAAESGGNLALLLRSASARERPSWAEVQWLVQAERRELEETSQAEERTVASKLEARRLQVRLLRNRGGRAGAELSLAIHPVTGQVHAVSNQRGRHEQKAAVRLASQLACPKGSSRRAAAG